MTDIAVMGYGVVGSGTVEVIYTNKESIEKKIGDSINVKRILDLRDFPNSPYGDKFTKNFEDILNDNDISVVAEVMGGVNPAFDFTKRLLESGKSVVTSNKELVATKGQELLTIAKENNVNYLFEASVGGGIPIIRPIYQCLAGNDIDEIVGILNGTTNFILTKMIKENMTFESALKLAQELGYAEKDPTADVEGHDACRKICILASLAFGYHVYPESVRTEGITKIELCDVEYLKSYNSVIKLIGCVKKDEEDKIFIFVAPAVIGNDSQLSSVDDVFNAILVRGNAIGDVVFYGKGAGKLPTASAVVGDIIDAIRHREKRQNIYWNEAKENYVKPISDEESVYYIRVSADEKTTQELKSQLGCTKELCCADRPSDESAFITSKISLSTLEAKLKELNVENSFAIRVIE